MFKFKIITIVYTWVFLLMFSNLFDRIIGIKIPTVLFYLLFFLLIILCLAKPKFNNLLIAVSLLPIFFPLALIFHPSTPIKANIMSIKDFILPMVSLWIPISLIKDKKEVINVVNYFFLIFVCYGVFQEFAFYFYGGMTGLEKYLPWDYNFINRELTTLGGARNLFRGSLLRFSGPMNSFIEGQVFVAILLPILFKCRKFLANNFVFKLNIILGFGFLALSLERTPIFMLVIILIIWNIPKVLRFKFILYAPIVVFLVTTISLVSYNKFKNNEIVATSIRSIARIATFQFKEDPAVKLRMEVQWKQSMQLAKTSLWGLGPARISPSAKKMIDNYFGPHNNFFAYYLGYGFVGLCLFLLLLMTVVFYASKCKSNTNWFVWGILAAYVACAIFNLPFCGKNGILFFFTVGFVLSAEKLINIQAR